MKKMATLFLLLQSAIPAIAEVLDVRYLQGLGDTRYHRVESEHVGRPYHVYIMLPGGYEPVSERIYPTIYVLDGGALFPMLAAYYQYLNFSDGVPDSIIVGISYGAGDFSNGNYRSTDYTAPSVERDYWGGAETFRTFLSEELMPLVESEYRSDAARRIIFGQSIGGQFVLYTAQTKPGLFWGHIASNPALHRNLPFFLEDHTTVKVPVSRLFVASGTRDDDVFRQPAERWMAEWGERTDKPWSLKVMDLEGHTHMSAPPESFRQGMLWLFADDEASPWDQPQR